MPCPRCQARHALYKERDEQYCIYCGYAVPPATVLPYVPALETRQRKEVTMHGDR